MENGTITQFFGKGGSGKTNICLQFVKKCIESGKRVIYIDTEGVSAVRMQQIFGEESDRINRNVLFFKPYTFEQQYEAVEKSKKLVDTTDVGLMVVDSMTNFYRKYYSDSSNDGRKGRRILAKMMIESLSLARQKYLPVLITNQVYTDIDENKLKPIGGHVVDHNSKTVMQLKRLAGGRRKAILLKHRSMKSNISIYFEIVDSGISTDSLFGDVEFHEERDLYLDNGITG